MPSRASIVTGRWPRNNGVWSNGIPLKETETTIAQILSKQRYETAALGKMHFTPFSYGWDRLAKENRPRYQAVPPEYKESLVSWRAGKLDDWKGPYYGFTDVNLVIGHSRRHEGHFRIWLQENFPEAIPLFEKENAIEPPSGTYQCWKNGAPQEAHSSTYVGNITVDFIKKNKDRPFFAFTSFPDPHHAFCPPAPYFNMYNPHEMPLPNKKQGELDNKPPQWSACFNGNIITEGQLPSLIPKDLTDEQFQEITAMTYGMISLIDHNVGRILNTLDEYGLAEKTIVVFMSDHGEFLGDHGLLLKGPVLMEGLVKIPMIWRLPDRFPAGRIGKLASNVDFAKTILHLLNVEPPIGVQGKSLAPVLTGETETVRDCVITEYDSFYFPDLNMKMLRKDQWKLVYYYGKPYGELYNLEEDPYEFINLYGNIGVKEIQEKLINVLLDELIITEDPLPSVITHA
jgi:arylsulfatase A-like enzyme